uniref:Uncharacterized protein n=1 Tax=Vombatus ursinus TaxID=29139 RepID=A0A4X2JQF5_VOMUR
MSITRTRTRAVPDLGGDPPSNAVRIKMTSGFSSRSSALSRTSSGYFVPSLLSRILMWKWELGLIV